MITKKQFEDVIDNYKKQNKIDDIVGNAIDLVSGSISCCFNSENYIYSSMFTLLKNMFNDDHDMIDWWVFEKILGERTDLNARDAYGVEIKMDTAGDLYDFLVKNMDNSCVDRSKVGS
jgi:hypothetical protein